VVVLQVNETKITVSVLKILGELVDKILVVTGPTISKVLCGMVLMVDIVPVVGVVVCLVVVVENMVQQAVQVL
jgi:hypothetical protein